MSDIIREAEIIIVIILGRCEAELDSGVKDWGKRVWTLPEILLGKSQQRIVLLKYLLGHELPHYTGTFSKIELARLAWDDALRARQLVDHFSGLNLSRLELLDIALECFKARNLKAKYPGDHIYAMMGLLRVRPLIDTGDSAFQAFARCVNTYTTYFIVHQELWRIFITNRLHQTILSAGQRPPY